MVTKDRHLKVKAELSPDKTEVTLTVLEQTHLSKEFSRKGASLGTHHSGVFKHGDAYLIGSYSSRTRFRKISYSPDIDLALAGDGTYVTFAVKYWPEIKEAIQAYNEWGAKGSPVRGERS